MSVIFEEDQNYKPQNFNSANNGWMVKLLIDKGIAPSEKVANIILLVIAGIFIAITIWLLKPSSPSNNNATVPENVPIRSGFQDLPREIK